MKPTLLIATLSMALASPTVFAKSELETLRALCQEQKRQINELEETNERLRAETHSKPAKIAAQDSAKPAASTPAATATTYTVKAGDNLDKIARKVGTTPMKLAKTNGLKSGAIIQPGQKLKVPGTTVASAPRETSAVAATSETAAKAAGKTHKVQTGETMFSISKKHGLSTEALTAANPKVKAASLRPGQVVSLSGDAPASTMISSQAQTKTPAAVEKLQEAAPAAKSQPVREASPAAPAPQVAAAPPEKEAPAPAAEGKIRPITIVGEMTYGEFATKHGTTAERLNALNGLDLTTATVLAKGSELYVPAQP